MHKFRKHPLIIADDEGHVRRLLVDLLRVEGFNETMHVRSGAELVSQVTEINPKVVFMLATLSDLSATDFTLAVRKGYPGIDRALSIIAIAPVLTPALFEDMRRAGVDEILTCPFSSNSLMVRLESVLLRPRRFIDAVTYRGPCRRRKMIDEYGGPLRRLSDPLASESGLEAWEAGTNRELVKLCVEKISVQLDGLSLADRRKLREIYAAVQDTQQLADDIKDEVLGAAARSLSRYIVGLGASGGVDPEVVSTHLSAMQALSVLGSEHAAERQSLVDGLIAVVDKRLGIASVA